MDQFMGVDWAPEWLGPPPIDDTKNLGDVYPLPQCDITDSDLIHLLVAPDSIDSVAVPQPISCGPERPPVPLHPVTWSPGLNWPDPYASIDGEGDYSIPTMPDPHTDLSASIERHKDTESAPPAQPNKLQPTRKAWNEHKSTIRRLYLEEGKPLLEVMELMSNEFDFHAT